MNPTELGVRLVALTGHSESDMVRRLVHLRKAGLLSKDGHGPHAADISANDGVNIIIGFMAAQKATQTVEAVQKYSKLIDKENNKFASELAAILNNNELAHQVEHVKVCRTFPQALIKLVSGKEKVFLSEDQPENPYDGRNDYTLSGCVFCYFSSFGFDETIEYVR